MPKLDTDLCSLGVQCLASLQQERDPVPACIVNETCHSCKCWANTASDTIGSLSIMLLYQLHFAGNPCVTVRMKPISKSRQEQQGADNNL